MMSVLPVRLMILSLFKSSLDTLVAFSVFFINVCFILLDILSFFVVIVNTLCSFIVCLHWLSFLIMKAIDILHINFVASHIIEFTVGNSFSVYSVGCTSYTRLSSANNDNFTHSF